MEQRGGGSWVLYRGGQRRAGPGAAGGGEAAGPGCLARGLWLGPAPPLWGQIWLFWSAVEEDLGQRKRAETPGCSEGSPPAVFCGMSRAAVWPVDGSRLG